MQERFQAVAKVHFGYFCMGLTAALVKAISWDPNSLVFSRMLIAGTVLAAATLWHHGTWKLDKKDLPKMLLSSVLFVIHWVTFFYAIKVADVPTAVVSVATIPMFSALIEPLLHKHKPDAIDLILATGVVFGVLIIVDDFSLQSGIGLGVLYGTISAFTKSLRDILSRQLVAHYGSMRTMMYQMLIGTVILLPIFKPASLEWTMGTILNIAIIAVIGTAIAHTFVTAGFHQLKAVTVNLIGSLAPLYQIFFGIVLVQNYPTVRTLIGGSIVLGIACFETWKKPNNKGL